MVQPATPDLDAIEDLDFEFEENCEIPAFAAASPGGWPDCPGRKAEWIGWRDCLCGNGPRYALLCDPCKEFYQQVKAEGAKVRCTYCASVVNPPTFERLKA